MRELPAAAWGSGCGEVMGRAGLGGVELLPAPAELNKCLFVACPGVLGRAGTRSQRSQRSQHSQRSSRRAGRWFPRGCCRAPAPASAVLTCHHLSVPRRALQHTNLLQCLAQCAEVTPYLLVMEFCPLVSPPQPPCPVLLAKVLPRVPQGRARSSAQLGTAEPVGSPWLVTVTPPCRVT